MPDNEIWARGLSNREVVNGLRNSIEFAEHHKLPRMAEILAEAARRIEASNDEKPSILGRERAIIDALTKTVHDAVKTRHDYTPVWETRRGSCFEVAITYPEENIRHIARVEITLDRLDRTTT